jgi:hypothetical protein
MMDELDLLNLGNDARCYETIVSRFLRMGRSSSLVARVTITIHETGRDGRHYRKTWPVGTPSVASVAKFVAHNIVQAYRAHAGHTFDSVTIRFD